MIIWKHTLRVPVWNAKNIVPLQSGVGNPVFFLIETNAAITELSWLKAGSSSKQMS